MHVTASIIIPVYNARPYLRLALISALSQSERDIEIIVVDDGSTDGSLESIADIHDPRIHVLCQANAGKSAALNRAIRKAKGKYYCILDADDEMHPERIALQVAALEANPDVAAVFCGHELLLGGHRMAPRLRAKDRAACQRDIDAMRMPAHDPTGMYRVSMVRDIEYEPSLRIGQGYDYILRVGERWPMMVLGECLYSYRIGHTSATTRSIEAREAFVRKVVVRACQRRGVTPDDVLSNRPEPRRSRARIADNGVSTHCLESAVDLCDLGRRGEALQVGWWCARRHPLDPQHYRALVAALLPIRVVQRMRARARQ